MLLTNRFSFTERFRPLAVPEEEQEQGDFASGGVDHLHGDPVRGLHVLSLGRQDGSGGHMRYIDTLY